jgi:hypothetical protein
MNCAKARFLLYAYLDRELPGAEEAALDHHVAFCAPCATRARSARCLSGILHHWRLRRDHAPLALLERLRSGRLEPRMRMRYAPLGLAASILLLILPLVADQAVPRGGVFSMVTPVALTSPRVIVPVARQMSGTFVCLQCEGRHEKETCPLTEPVHELGFCADDGETFRVMTTDAAFASASVGREVTVEGVAFPESGFLRASRVGY